jgi:hypothetical protein
MQQLKGDTGGVGSESLLVPPTDLLGCCDRASRSSGTPALSSAGPGLESRPGNRLSWQDFRGFTPVSPKQIIVKRHLITFVALVVLPSATVPQIRL